MQNENETKSIKKERVLITGNAGALGQALTKKLLRNEAYELISVDRRPFQNKPDHLQHLQLDLRRKSAITSIKKLKPQSIIHLGVIRNPQRHRRKSENAYYFNLESTSQLLSLAETMPIRKFVFLSTANLYGPSANTSGILSEETPLHGANKSPEFRDLVSLDMMVQSFFWKQPKTQTIILRPCHIVGKNLRNAPTRYLMLETIPKILGFDPMLQLIHENDLIDAICLSLSSNVRGIFNLTGPDTVPLSRIIKYLDRPTISVPERLLKAFIAGTFFSRRSSFPAAELDHLKYPCIIDSKRAQDELGFLAKKTTRMILQEIKKTFAALHKDD